MGRYYWDKKDTVEESRSVSIAFLRKHGYFCGYRGGRIFWTNSMGDETGSIGIAVSVGDGENYAQFNYTITDRNSGQKTDYDYKVRLTTTPCLFGGVRYWFICPLFTNGVYCGRRVANLYLAPGANYFGCRHCHNLSYESRNEPRLARPGGIGYPIRAERLYEELYKKTRRWTWRGKPTKKARKLKRLEQRTEGILDAYDALLKR
jgi:hypothetical protein